MQGLFLLKAIPLPTQHKYRFGKEEKLKSRKLIGRLFSEGNKLNQFPLRCLWLSGQEEKNIRVSVSVSSRNFKKAVDRNRIKRIMREAYRLNKACLCTTGNPKGLSVMFIYTGTEMPDYIPVEKSIRSLLKKISHSIHEGH